MTVRRNIKGPAMDILKANSLEPGACIATAEIIYHLPDHPGILQSFVWQHRDLAPDYPRLRQFLEFWSRNLDGKLHSVSVAGAPLSHNRSLRYARHHATLH